MAGITTSEIMSGEQPKNDDLGSRIDELTKKVEKQRDALNAFEQYALDSIEALVRKTVVKVLIEDFQDGGVMQKKIDG
jgi:hypothetical protein